MSKTEFCVMESEGSSSQVAIWRRGVGPWLVRLLLIYILKVRMFFFCNLSQCARSIHLIHAMKSNARARVYNHFAITDNQHRPIFATTILTL